MKDQRNQNTHEVILSIVCLCLVLYLISGNHYFASVGLAIGVFALLSDKVRNIIVTIWSKVLLVLGKVNGFVLLSLVFFLILSPIAFVYRIFNKDSLSLKPKAGSYFAVRDHTFAKSDLENPW